MEKIEKDPGSTMNNTDSFAAMQRRRQRKSACISWFETMSLRRGRWNKPFSRMNRKRCIWQSSGSSIPARLRLSESLL